MRDLLVDKTFGNHRKWYLFCNWLN